MTADAQEALFKQVQVHFPKWNKQQVSGCVHGINEGMGEHGPQRVYIHDGRRRVSYGLGYCYGFIDARGEDAINSEVFKDFVKELGPVPIAFRWWLNEETTEASNQ